MSDKTATSTHCEGGVRNDEAVEEGNDEIGCQAALYQILSQLAVVE